MYPQVYCASDAGLVDAAHALDFGTVVEQCTPFFAKCTTALPGTPGWLCCNAFGDLIDGSPEANPTIDWQYQCLPPDGGRLPLFFPAPLDVDADKHGSSTEDARND
jgi:hypothetical protein